MNGFPYKNQIARRFIGRGEHTTSERLAAIEEVAHRVEGLVAQGWRMRPWHPTSPGSPCVERDGGRLDWDTRLIAGWMDHPYRLIPPGAEPPVFVSEPYQLDDRSLVRLAYLQNCGWRVDVRPEMALHYPGRTVAIWIRRIGGAS
jgi:hypothetical protein